MAIPIIGESKEAQTSQTELPTPDTDALPRPSSAPENTPVLEETRILELADHDEPMVRTFAVGHLGRSETDASLAKLIERLSDQEAGVAESAARALVRRDSDEVFDAVAERLEKAEGTLAGECTRLLARKASDRLVEVLKKRSRLDDEAFAMTTAELGRARTPEAVAYLDKSMNRAGAMQPDRRGSLYAAALLSGDPKLCQRVIGLAISDSREDEPAGQTSPARAAVASVAGLQLEAAVRAQGENLLRGLREDESAAAFLPEDAKKALDDGLRKQDVAECLAAFEAIAALEARDDASEDHRSIIERRSGLLRAILAKKDAIAGLGAGPAAIFIVAALDAGQMLALSSKPVAESPSLVTVAKVLETTPEELVARTEEDWVSAVSSMSERQVRGLVTPLGNESIYDAEVLERILRALVKGGHGLQVMDAAAHARSESFTRLALESLGDQPKETEALIVETLEQRPLDAHTSRIALMASLRIPTQRVALAIGHRFLDLREVARPALAEAIFRLGDVRLAPIVKTRAFPGEPEEMAFVLLSLLEGEAVEGDLAERLERLRTPPGMRDQIRVPLRCKACGETLVYGFDSVFVDPKSDRPDGDPVYAGEEICKACGAVEHMESTPQAIQIMTQEMMSALAYARSGGMMGGGHVMPRLTTITGRETGIAEALRVLNREVSESPDSIRSRLRRARMLLLLQRKGARDDIDKALEIDGASPEARVLLAGFCAQRDELDEALSTLLEAHGGLTGEEEPRLYESERDGLLAEVEDSLLELEALGRDLPDTLDLTSARHRRADREAAQAEALQQMRERMQAGELPELGG